VTARPDPLIHPIARLSICALLASGADWVEFAALRDAAGISDSVLSKQSRVLEEAGYLQVRKGAVGRRPRTWFRLTAAGRRAVADHLAWLVQLEASVSARTPVEVEDRVVGEDRAEPSCQLPAGVAAGESLPGVVEGGKRQKPLRKVDAVMM
jgi:DNA-binding MarR family transcriptional regulator